MFAQWLHTAGLAPALLAVVLEAIAESFPDYVIYNAGQCKARFVVPQLSEENAGDEDGGTLKFELLATDPYGFFDSDEKQVNINQVDDDSVGTHSTAGCFIQALTD